MGSRTCELKPGLYWITITQPFFHLPQIVWGEEPTENGGRLSSLLPVEEKYIICTVMEKEEKCGSQVCLWEWDSEKGHRLRAPLGRGGVGVQISPPA